MSKLAFRVVKYKAGNIFGIQKHNQREGENHSNKEIDIEKSGLNIDLINDEKINFSKKINKIIDENKTSATPVRNTSVLMISAIVSSSKEFFEELDHKQQIKFFEEATEFFKTRFGEQNLVSANVHFDENTPHMHISFVPITVDGRLSAKDVITRKELQQLQTELPKHLKNKGFDIERGLESSGVKHMKTLDYKKQLTELSKPLEQLDSLFRNSKLNKKDLIIAKENFEELKNLLEGSLEVVELKRDVKVLENSLKVKEATIEQNKGTLEVQEKIKSNYREKIIELEKNIKELKQENKKITDIAIKSKKLNNVFFKTINQIKDPKFLNENGKKQVKSIVDDSQKEVNDIINPRKSQTQSTSIEM